LKRSTLISTFPLYSNLKIAYLNKREALQNVRKEAKMTLIKNLTKSKEVNGFGTLLTQDNQV
jgi:hypothetical protein